MFNIKKIKNQFPIFDNNSFLHYFDNASSTLKPKQVINLINYYYSNNGSNVHRGLFSLSNKATLLLEETRKKTALFLHASLPEEIIFTLNNSHSINILAWNLIDEIMPEESLLISSFAHNSLFLPWKKLAIYKKKKIIFFPLKKNLEIDFLELENIFRTQKVKFIILEHASNLLGTLNNLSKIISLSKKYNVYNIVDLAQSIAHLEINVMKLNIDYGFFSSTKIYGPTGVGILFGKKNLLEKMKTNFFGSNMISHFDNNNFFFKPLPFKLEIGTPNIAGIIGFQGALDFLKQYEMKEIYQHEMFLTNFLLQKMALLQEIFIFNKNPQMPIITFKIINCHSHDIVTFLNQFNIAIRSGRHCNDLTVNHLQENDVLRISLAIYNTLEDCHFLISKLKQTILFFKNLKLEKKNNV